MARKLEWVLWSPQVTFVTWGVTVTQLRAKWLILFRDEVYEMDKWPEAAAAQSTRMADAQIMVSGAFEKRISKSRAASLAAGALGGLAIQMTGVTVRWCVERKQPDVEAVVNEILTTFDQLFSSAGRTEPACHNR